MSHPRSAFAVATALAALGALSACRSAPATTTPAPAPGGQPGGRPVGDTATGQAMLDQGFRAIAYSGDLWIYQQALREGISSLREMASGQ